VGNVEVFPLDGGVRVSEDLFVERRARLYETLELARDGEELDGGDSGGGDDRVPLLPDIALSGLKFCTQGCESRNGDDCFCNCPDDGLKGLDSFVPAWVCPKGSKKSNDFREASVGWSEVEESTFGERPWNRSMTMPDRSVGDGGLFFLILRVVC
jgi:hypothetical protein